MLDWLTTTWETNGELSLATLFLRLGASFVAGCVVAAIYRVTRSSESVSPTFQPTLILLSILIAMVTQVIGDHIARAFSLVGALSIVRFRTVVETTQDIAFVIFAVVAGMAVGADHYMVAVVGAIFVGAAAWLFRTRQPATTAPIADSSLVVRLGVGHDPEIALKPAFDKFFAACEFCSGVSARQGSALDLAYRVRLRQGCLPTTVLGDLNRVEGVQSVELKM